MQPRVVLSIGNFFCAGHFFLVLYVLTPYLATFLPGSETGFVIAFGAAITLLAFPFVPRLVRRVGVKRLALASGLLSGLLLALLALMPGIVAALLLVALFAALQPVIGYLLDLLLESTVTSENETGRIRTAFLTFGNLALVCAPLMIGFLLGTSDDYTRVFLFAIGSLATSLLIFSQVRVVEHPMPTLSNMRVVLHCILRDADFRSVGLAYVTLQIFYNLAAFFVPLYLHTVLGMPWSELGWVFAVMLVPFVLLEYPAGWLADRVFGDRELMALGFLIMGAAFAALGFVHGATPITALVLVLVVSRVGAALVEATAESHFFRRVSAKDPNTVGVFRMMRPMGSLIAPALGALVLMGSTYSVLFFVSGIAILLVGVASALSIKDVR